MSGSLRRLQERYGEDLDRTLYGHLDGSTDATFLGMMRYQFGYVDETLRPRPSTGGKRFRPLLCLLACEFAGGRWQTALTAASAIELLHNFSLIHDDIEDRDPARRHRPTVWKVWGEPQAINVGDAVFAEAVRTILHAHPDPSICLTLSQRFADIVLALTEGQYMDMSFETRSDVTPDEYLAMIDRKTAQLIAFSLWAGTVIASAADATRTHLHAFGHDLGRAFQIHDDIMGIWGSPDVTGKEAGKDLQNRKKTLPLLIAAQRASPAQRLALRRFLDRESDEPDEVLAVLSDTGAEDRARAQVEEFLGRALHSLAAAQMDERATSELTLIAAELTGQRPVSN